jgi:hypothetical protein
MFAVHGSGVIVLALAGSSRVGTIAFVLLFGIGFGIGFGVGTVARPALLAHTFGVARYATVSGLLALVITLTTTLGPVTAGAARTTTGTYSPVLLVVGVLCGVAALSLPRAARANEVPR